MPLIFATGYDEKIIPADFRQALVLQKPFDPESPLSVLWAERHLSRADVRG